MKKSVLVFVLFCALASVLYAQTIPGISYEPVNVTHDEILRAIHEMGQYSASQRGAMGNDTLWEPVLSHSSTALIITHGAPNDGYVTGTAAWWLPPPLGIYAAGPVLTGQKYNYTSPTSVLEVLTWIGKLITQGASDSIRAFVYRVDEPIDTVGYPLDTFQVTLLGISNKKCTCDLDVSLSQFKLSNFVFPVPVSVPDSFIVAIEVDDNSTINADVLDDSLAITSNTLGDGMKEFRAVQHHPLFMGTSQLYPLYELGVDVDVYIFPVIVGGPGGIEDRSAAQNFSLLDAFPNPLNAAAVHIGYDLGKNGDVEISLYNMMGQQVKSIKEHNVPVGRHFLSVDLSDLSAGLYVYQIRSGNFSASKKLNLVK